MYCFAPLADHRLRTIGFVGRLRSVSVSCNIRRQITPLSFQLGTRLSLRRMEHITTRSRNVRVLSTRPLGGSLVWKQNGNYNIPKSWAKLCSANNRIRNEHVRTQYKVNGRNVHRTGRAWGHRAYVPITSRVRPHCNNDWIIVHN